MCERACAPGRGGGGRAEYSGLVVCDLCMAEEDGTPAGLALTGGTREKLSCIACINAARLHP